MAWKEKSARVASAQKIKKARRRENQLRFKLTEMSQADKNRSDDKKESYALDRERYHWRTDKKDADNHDQNQERAIINKDIDVKNSDIAQDDIRYRISGPQDHIIIGYRAHHHADYKKNYRPKNRDIKRPVPPVYFMQWNYFTHIKI